MIEPLVSFSPYQTTSISSDMCKCPVCKDALVKRPHDVSFSDTSISVPTCSECCEKTLGIISVQIRKSAYGELL